MLWLVIWFSSTCDTNFLHFETVPEQMFAQLWQGASLIESYLLDIHITDVQSGVQAVGSYGEYSQLLFS